MMDQRKVLEKLRVIKENLDKLNSFKDVPLNLFVSNFEKYDSARYNLQTAIEAMLDICNHIIARKAYKVPRNNAEAFRLLCHKGILSPDMEDAYTAMARFRNRVVHLYDQVDNQEIYRIIREDLGNIIRFMEDVKKIVGL